MATPLVFDLTPMTRGADKGRRFVIGGFDLEKTTLVVGGISIIPGLVLTGFLFPLMQMWALLFPVLTVAIGFWLIVGRSTQGMKLKNWQTLLDKQKNRSGQFFICGHPIDITYSDITYVRSLTTPVERKEVADLHDVFAFRASA